MASASSMALAEREPQFHHFGFEHAISGAPVGGDQIGEVVVIRHRPQRYENL
jgi:hypothetical protein